MNKFAVLFIICAIAAGSANASWQDYQPFCYFPDMVQVSLKQNTKAKVDVNLYSGTWYEIVRKPMSHQKECVCSQAQYTNNGDHIGVFNQCNTKDGGLKSASAKAYTANDYNTRLKVYFAPFIAGEYWILDIDPNYQWVIVGEPCKKAGFILSRQKTLDEKIKQEGIRTLSRYGYDVSNLVFRGNC